MTDKKIFEKNIKSLIRSAGPQQHIPDDKKNQILKQLIGPDNKFAPSAKTIPIWKLIINNPVVKMAAAAVILIILGLLLVHWNTEQKKLETPNKITSHQLEPTSLLSMSLTFQKKGLAGLEEQLDKTLQSENRPYKEINLSDILNELNNHENERI